MITRLWHGWTDPADADEYERLLAGEVLPGIDEDAAGDEPGGLEGYEVLRRDRDDEVEFLTILYFDSYDAVRRFAGEEYRQAHVPPAARELLSRWDDRADHFECRERRPPR